MKAALQTISQKPRWQSKIWLKEAIIYVPRCQSQDRPYRRQLWRLAPTLHTNYHLWDYFCARRKVQSTGGLLTSSTPPPTFASLREAPALQHGRVACQTYKLWAAFSRRISTRRNPDMFFTPSLRGPFLAFLQLSFSCVSFLSFACFFCCLVYYYLDFSSFVLFSFYWFCFISFL